MDNDKDVAALKALVIKQRDRIEQQASRIVELLEASKPQEGEADPHAGAAQHDSDCSLHNAPALPVGPCDCSVSQAGAAALSEVSDTSQEWSKLDGATAFHLIERHADDWAETGRMMDAWRDAKIAARAATSTNQADTGVAGALSLTDLNVLSKALADADHDTPESGAYAAAQCRKQAITIVERARAGFSNGAGEPVAYGAFHFGGNRNGKLYSHSDTQEQIEKYIADVHQSNDSLTLRSGALYTTPAAQADEVRDAALEDAAVICGLEARKYHRNEYPADRWDEGAMMALANAADYIRALKRTTAADKQEG